MVEEFLPLARHLVKRYGRDNRHAEDLFQVASMGLLKAIDRFDPELGNAFTSFATPTILGEIKRYFRDKSWTVRVRDLQELSLNVTRAADELESELGRAPTASEVAERTGSSVELVLEARVAASARHGLSLDHPGGGDTDAEGTSIAARFGVTDAALARAEDTATVERLMACLDERERTILQLRFHQDLTQAEIGEQLGISQMHVSRLIRKSITRLRTIAEHTPQQH